MVAGGADENAALHAAPGLLALGIIPILSPGRTTEGLARSRPRCTRSPGHDAAGSDPGVRPSPPRRDLWVRRCGAALARSVLPGPATRDRKRGRPPAPTQTAAACPRCPELGPRRSGRCRKLQLGDRAGRDEPGCCRLIPAVLLGIVVQEAGQGAGV